MVSPGLRGSFGCSLGGAGDAGWLTSAKAPSLPNLPSPPGPALATNGLGQAASSPPPRSVAKAKRAKGYKWKPQTPLMCFIDVLAVLLLPLMLNQGSAEQGADISMAKAPVKMSAVQRPAGAKEPPPVDVFVSLAGERFVLLLDGVEVSAEEVQD